MMWLFKKDFSPKARLIRTYFVPVLRKRLFDICDSYIEKANALRRASGLPSLA